MYALSRELVCAHMMRVLTHAPTVDDTKMTHEHTRDAPFQASVVRVFVAQTSMHNHLHLGTHKARFHVCAVRVS
jgi:hypothetical protein